MSENDASRADALITALRMLRRRWRVIALCMIGCLAVAVVTHQRRAVSYASTANVAFGLTNLSDLALEVNPNSGDPEREAGTQVLIAQSPEVARAVATQLQLKVAPQQLVKAISVEAVPNADVLNVTAESSEPVMAQRLADAFATQYIAFKAKAQTDGIDSAVARLREQLAQVPPDSLQARSLGDSLQRLSQLRAVANGNARVIGRAEPAEATGMGLAVTGALALILGAALGLVAAFAREALDRRITRVEDFEAEYKLSALSAVPQSAFRARRAVERRGELEPYRILRSAVDASNVDMNVFTVLVTSAVPGEGKTSSAIDLAQAVALTGRSVTLVELDLRRPTFSRHLAIDPRHGVTTVLNGRMSLESALVRPFDDLPNLAVLPSGSLPPNPSELLGAEELEELLTRLTFVGDGPGRMVIIDAPPLLPVADTQVLLNNPAIDKVLIVARAGLTTREEVRRARAILERHLLPALGVVVTGIDNDSVQYGYPQQEPEAHLIAEPRESGTAGSAGGAGRASIAAAWPIEPRRRPSAEA